MGPRVWPRPNVSICNSYGAKPGLTVTDQDKPSAPSTNISICNSYGAKQTVDVTDQDKPIRQNTTSRSVTATRQNQPQMLQIETVELPVEEQSPSVTSRPRIPYLLLQIKTNVPSTRPADNKKGRTLSHYDWNVRPRQTPTREAEPTPRSPYSASGSLKFSGSKTMQV